MLDQNRWLLSLAARPLLPGWVQRHWSACNHDRAQYWGAASCSVDTCETGPDHKAFCSWSWCAGRVDKPILQLHPPSQRVHAPIRT